MSVTSPETKGAAIYLADGVPAKRELAEHCTLTSTNTGGRRVHICIFSNAEAKFSETGALLLRLPHERRFSQRYQPGEVTMIRDFVTGVLHRASDNFCERCCDNTGEQGERKIEGGKHRLTFRCATDGCPAEWVITKDREKAS